MSIFKSLILVCLSATVSIVNAEPHCPGNVDSLRLRLIQNVQIIVPVTINKNGPYDFLVDTGAQITTVDPTLAKALDLKIEGTTGIIGVGNYARTPFTTLDSVQAGSEVVEQLMAVIQDLGQIQLADARVRGVLAGNFLEHFGLLIDYRQRLICLDKGDELEAKVKGQHIGLVAEPDPGKRSPTPQTLAVAVRLSGRGKESLVLRLDSGINVPLLYPSADTARLVVSGTSPLRGRGTDGVDHAFAVLSRQEVQIGPHTFHEIPFVMPVSETESLPKPEVDGLLPTALFQRVYINYAHNYAVLEP
jgi:Aspartyl protease